MRIRTDLRQTDHPTPFALSLSKGLSFFSALGSKVKDGPSTSSGRTGEWINRTNDNPTLDPTHMGVHFARNRHTE